MKFLIDTHLLLWWLTDSEQLSQTARDIIQATEPTIFISAASVWEMRIKQAIGKLKLPKNFAEVLEEQPFERLSITVDHTHKVSELPMHHKDPFDRLLIAQATLDDLTILSHDKIFEQYKVRCQIF